MTPSRPGRPVAPPPFRGAGLRAIALGGVLCLAGCVSFLPLPVSPLQIMTKQFPATVADTAGAPRAYTIKGDTFSYPTVGLEVTRPNNIDWEFVPGNSSVTVSLRNNLSGTEPKPGFLVQLISLPPGTDVEASKLTDLVTTQKGGGVVTSVPRFINGTLGDAWTITQQDPKTNLVTTSLRVYVTLPDMLVLLQATAAQDTFPTLGPYFGRMLETIVLPKPQNGATPVPAPPLSPVLAPNIKGSTFTDPTSGASFTAADANWAFGLNGANPAVRRGGVSKGIDPVPQFTMTAVKAQGVDLAKVKAADKQSLDAAKVAVTVAPRTVNGFAGEQWTFTKPDVLGKPETTQRVYVQNSAAIVILEGTAMQTDFAAVQADFDKMVDGATLPAGSAVPDASASGASAAPAASGAASPAPSGG